MKKIEVFKTREILKPQEKLLNELLVLITRQGRSGELDEGGVSLLYHLMAMLNKEWKVKYKDKK